MKIKKGGKADRALLLVSATAAIAMVVLEATSPRYLADPLMSGICEAIVTRALGTFVFLPLILRYGYNVFGFAKKGRGGALLTVFVAFAVVLNNFPIRQFLLGNVYTVRGAEYVFAFALQCLAVGIFEETAFRGLLFMVLLEKHRQSKKQIVSVVIASSAIFGLVHLFNLLGGASFGAVALQVGYSFLIGAMLSVVLLRTKCVWICALLHAIFNFGGYLMPTLGNSSAQWDSVTVMVTVALALVACAYMASVCFSVEPKEAATFFASRNDVNDEKNGGRAADTNDKLC